MIWTFSQVLIHQPGIDARILEAPGRIPEAKKKLLPKTPEDLKEARIAMWEGLQDLKNQGKIKDIGVSNFTRFHLEQLIANPRCTEVPVLNQIEFNPYNADYDIVKACKENNILVQAYAPLGSSEKYQKGAGSKKVLENEVLVNMAAKKKNCTVAQIALGWALSKGIGVVTKTEQEKRMKENISATNIKLNDDEVKAIDAINIGQRFFCDKYSIL